MEDSHRNVAVGYLSVLLGYLNLNPDIAKLVRAQLGGKALEPLIASVEEFISHHRKVDDMFAKDADGHNPQTGLTTRLQSMVTRLRMA